MSISKINTNSIAAGASPTMTDLTLSGGLYVGGTTSANFLDDYEEGTFTPTIRENSSATSVTYVGQTGNYTKIGELVIARCFVAISGHNGSTSSALWRLDSLPFTSIEDSGAHIVYDNAAGTQNGVGRNNNGTNYTLSVVTVGNTTVSLVYTLIYKTS